GGFMGQFAPGTLRAELRDALKGVGAGQFTPVVHIPSGYAILKIMGGNAVAASKVADPARSFAMAATGTVKYVNDVDGLGEAEAALQNFPKPNNWNADPRTVCELRKQSLAAVIPKMKERLATEFQPGDSALNAYDTMEAHFALAQLYAYQGNMEPAIEEYQASYQLALSSVSPAVPPKEESLGIAYLHKSEMENDVYRAPGDMCLFPMRPGDAY